MRARRVQRWDAGWAELHIGPFWFAVDLYDGALLSLGVMVRGIWRTINVQV